MMSSMAEEVIYELTKLYLKEVNKKENKFIMTKKELINFCLKMMKVIKKVEEIEDENKFTRIEQLSV